MGANDGIVSIASLMVRVADASTARGEVLAAGVADLVAGVMAMAAGECDGFPWHAAVSIGP